MSAATFVCVSEVSAQQLRDSKNLGLDSRAAQQKSADLIDDVLLPEVSLRLDPRRSKLIRTKKNVSRFSIANPENLEVVQFSPTEFELIGLKSGQTTFTLWFPDGQTLRYLVEVDRDTDIEDRRKSEYGDLQDMVNELFPNSQVQIIPVADKIILRGQARDSEEAAQILRVVSNHSVNQGGGILGPGSFGGLVSIGSAATPYPGESDLPASNVINLLDVPGEQQVMLRVRVAELSRTALRQMGVDLNINASDFTFTQLLGINGAFTAVLDTDEVRLALSALSSNSYSRILAEPNLVTLSGHPASFIAGGEFAVPIVVGVQGAAAATTNFRGFGTQLSFTPTVIDKDRIRLQVAPSFSTLNQSFAVNGIPGLNSRAVVTTVDLREGQWLAIAGLIQDQQSGSKSRVPFVGDIPILDTVFSRKTANREETELLVLVSPELVHPLENEDMPVILPGMEVTEPTDCQFFLYGNYEGDPNCAHRSTVHNVQQRNNKAEMHRGRGGRNYQKCQDYYVHGAHGFSQ